jgi:hypothetical protein
LPTDRKLRHGQATVSSDDSRSVAVSELPTANGDEPPAIGVAEAAKRLGKTVDAVRSLARRGKLKARRGNDGKLLIMLAPGDEAATVADEMADGHDEARAVLRDQLEDMRDQIEHWRRSSEEARVAQARAEERAEAQRELVAELHKLLDDARRPWWRRWMG